MKARYIKFLVLISIILLITDPTMARSSSLIKHHDLFLPDIKEIVNLSSTFITNEENNTNPEKGDNPQSIDPEGIQRLSEQSGGAAISISPATGAVTFIQLKDQQIKNLSDVLKIIPSTQSKTEPFFVQYGSLFGIKDSGQELSFIDSRLDQFGYTHQSYQQVYQGVPVFAGVLRLHKDKEQRITAVNGTYVPNLDINVIPSLDPEKAVNLALSAVNVPEMTANLPSLLIYREGLLKGIPGENHLVYEVEVSDGRSTREYVYVDAHSGEIVDQISAVISTLSRKIYHEVYNPASLVWTEGNVIPYEGGTSIENENINNIIDGTAEAYNFFFKAFGRDSFDGLGSSMQAVNNQLGMNCPNANWNGTTTNYCHGVTADDTVAHEWAHAYTQYTHDLIYQWQPGALNEAFSDIWGEVVDLLNNRGSDIPGGLRTDGACSVYSTPSALTTLAPGLGSTNHVDDSYRWLSSEDDPSFGGAIRDMYTPNCFSHPAKVSDNYYSCSSGDQGGVHTNSGVPNHTFALTVDGGIYNNQAVSGIGLTKSAHIYWRAQDIYQVPATDFSNHADSLDQACEDLIGVTLKDLVTGNPSSSTITPSDCGELRKAIAATELKLSPSQCKFDQLLKDNPLPLCPGQNAPKIKVYGEDFEDSAPGWNEFTQATSPEGNSFHWIRSEQLPGERASKAFYAIADNSGSCKAGDDVSRVMTLISPPIELPQVATPQRLVFEHYIATEFGYDGGNVKLKVNDGPWQAVVTPDFTSNPYNTTLLVPANTNPLKGQTAFSGMDDGRVTGSWGESRINLTDYAQPGDTVQLRFDFGTDGCVGLDGWYIDNVEIYYCENQITTPDMKITPTEISTFGNRGTIHELKLSVSNHGNDRLNWQIFENNPGVTDLANSMQQRVVDDRTDQETKLIIGSALKGEDIPAQGSGNIKNIQPATIIPGDIINDGSFEIGTPNPYWGETTLHEYSVICNSSICGLDYPRSGDWYVWFGGYANEAETTTVAQDVNIPIGSANLSFHILMARISDLDNGNFSARLDGREVYQISASDYSKYSGGYTRVDIDVSDYADGWAHTLSLHWENPVGNPGNINLFLDDVSMTIIPTGCELFDNPWLSVTPSSGTLPFASSNQITFSMNTTHLSTGTYPATVCLVSNDPTKPLIIIPLTLKVFEQIKIFVPLIQR